MNFHPHNFTFAGRLILLIAVVIAVGGTVSLIIWNGIALPVRLPIVLVAIPPLCVAGVFVALSMLLLKVLGLEFFCRSSEEME